MKSLNIQISDLEFNQLGLTGKTISFSELSEIIGRKLNLQTLERSTQLADKYGLSKMTMEEINAEIESVRNEKTDS